MAHWETVEPPGSGNPTATNLRRHPAQNDLAAYVWNQPLSGPLQQTVPFDDHLLQQNTSLRAVQALQTRQAVVFILVSSGGVCGAIHTECACTYQTTEMILLTSTLRLRRRKP